MVEQSVAPVHHEVLVVGAGFGGMGAAIQLKRLGYDDLLIVDREDGLGGTWHINRYPGLAVDIASVTYSFSFEQNPDWSRMYAPGSELKAYAEHVADTYDLRRHMRFGVAVEGCSWDESTRCWHVATSVGELTARYLVVGTGFLSHPKRPDIPGLDDFGGTVMHTAEWDDAHDLSGERVAVIGTGATSVQLVPAIADVVEHLYVHQRTPIWVAPKIDGPVPGPLRAAFRHVPGAQAALRLANNTLLELLGAGVLFERQAGVVLEVAEQLCRAHLRAQVRDPATRRALTPDYDFFCKRPTFSNDYLSSFNRDDVTLVTGGIEAVTPTGIRTADRVEREVDTILLATGFHVMDEANFPPFEILGVGGLDLGKQWRTDRYQSYEGLTVNGFPNLLYLPSPYGFSGLSFFFTIEMQMAHMARLLGEVQRRGARTFEPTAEAQDRFMARMERQSPETLWARGDCSSANSYYFNEHGETSLARLTPTLDGQVRARRFPLTDYRLA